MENHNAREGFGGVFAGGAEIGRFDLGHDGSGVVADVFFGAVVVSISVWGRWVSVMFFLGLSSCVLG